MILNAWRDFVKLETSSGALLVMSAIAAMIIANTPFSGTYGALIDLPVEVRVGDFGIAKPLLLWINDGLMAVFFLLVGLELKREILEGEISSAREAALPAFGAFGGMLVPALIYTAVNRHDAAAMQGWAIPAATDIAFALAVLGLLGRRVPLSLRVLLVSIAIFDDIGAIVIIALFYTSDLSVTALTIAGLCLPVLFLMNRRGVREITPYLLVGLVMWAAVLKSGVHATLAGVLLAMFIPLQKDAQGHAPLQQLEHDLHTAVAFVILPVFAFANAGIPLAGVTLDNLLHPVPLGIVAGLFIGKQTGIFLFCALGVALGVARLPADLRWPQLYGVAVLCGIGFTMSLFMGSLAFEETGVNRVFDERLGIIIGSLLSAAAGYAVLRLTTARD